MAHRPAIPEYIRALDADAIVLGMDVPSNFLRPIDRHLWQLAPDHRQSRFVLIVAVEVFGVEGGRGGLRGVPCDDRREEDPVVAAGVAERLCVFIRTVE